MAEAMLASDGALQIFEGFTPFTFDASNLQKFLQSILKQVELCQQENASLKAEIYEMKVGQRLDTLEQSLQEIADLQRPGSGYGAVRPSGGVALPTIAEEADKGRQGVGQDSWITSEFNEVKDRMSQMERKAEALWHVQEEDVAVRGLLERLKADLDIARVSIDEAHASNRTSQGLVDQLEVAGAAASKQIRDLQDRMTVNDAHIARALEDKRELSSKLENNVNLIFDQIRHVEGSLGQRLTLAETSQISTLQEVDEMKEAAAEVSGRLEEAKRHIAALEGKLESFNTQVAAAISPLHNSLTEVRKRLDELMTQKQDVETAVTLDDVNTAVSRAIDHADRRADKIIKSIGAMEERVEELNDLKANKSEVVMSSDLEALLTAHAAEMDRHLEALKGEILRVVSMKADKEEMAALDAKLGARISSLENAILKGLKAISDKVSAALAEKLDLVRFNEFKMQVRAILADVEDRLKDWSPLAMGLKAPMDGTSGLGASSCLCCDNRVRNAKDLQSMGFSSVDKVFTPEKLPLTEGLLPSIQRSPDVAAHSNAKLAARKKDVSNLLTRSTQGIPEALPGHSGHSQTGENRRTTNTVDAGAFLGLDMKEAPGQLPGRKLSGGSRPKVDVETISGAIAQGRIPSRQGVQSRGAPAGHPPATAWEPATAISQTGPDLQIDMTRPQSVST